MPLGVRSDFKPRLFKELINEKGYNCLLQHAIPCSNIDTYTHAHPKDCPYCHGTGFVYYGEEKVKVMMTSLSKDKRYIISPDLLLGQAMATFKAETSVQFRDRIVNLDSLIRYSQLVKHSSNSIDELRFKIFELETVYRFLDNIPSELITEGMTTYPNMMILQGMGERNVNLIELKEGVDYNLDDNRIIWLSDKQPTINEIYSVRYKTHPAWIIISFPHVVRDTTTVFGKSSESTENLPIQGLCKLEFLFYKDQLDYEWSSFYSS